MIKLYINCIILKGDNNYQNEKMKYTFSEFYLCFV